MSQKQLLAVFVLISGLMACREARLKDSELERLVVTPESITIVPAIIVVEGEAQVLVEDFGGQATNVPVSVSAPFMGDVVDLHLAKGEGAVIHVR